MPVTGNMDPETYNVDLRRPSDRRGFCFAKHFANPYFQVPKD